MWKVLHNICRFDIARKILRRACVVRKSLEHDQPDRVYVDRIIRANFRALTPTCGNARARKACPTCRTLRRRKACSHANRVRIRTKAYKREAYPRHAVSYRGRAIGAIIGIEKRRSRDQRGVTKCARPQDTAPDNKARGPRWRGPRPRAPLVYICTRARFSARVRAFSTPVRLNNADSSGEMIALWYRTAGPILFFFSSLPPPPHPPEQRARGGAGERDHERTLHASGCCLREDALLADCRTFRGSIGLR